MLHAQVSRSAGYYNDANPDSKWPSTGWAQRRGATTAYYRILSVRKDLDGGVPAGLVRGRHAQPGSTCTPGPACGSGKQLSSASACETTLATSATGDAGPSSHQGQTVKLLGIAEGQRYLLGWRHPWTPYCSMGATIRWLWGVKRPSRLTCSATGRFGVSCPAGAAPSARVPV